VALIVVNDVAVISGSIAMPKVGVWTADLIVDQIDGSGFSAGTKVTIKADGGIELTGVVAPARTGDFLDAVHVRVLGGAGGMAKAATARSYVQPGAFVRDVLDGLANDSGETLDSAIDASFTGGNLAAWATMAKPCSWNLRALLQFVAPTFSWRITPAGKLWMGAETWPAATGDHVIVDQSPSEGSYVLGCDTPFLVPGVSLDGVGNVARVEHSITRSGVVSSVSVDLPEGDRGFQASIARMVAANTAGIDYLAFYRAKVNSQSADGKTLDVTPDDARLAGFQRVPLRNGLPGLTVQVTPGAYVLVGFMGGDPRLPFVQAWEGGESPVKVVLKGATVYAGDEAGALALVTKTDFDTHTHLFTGPSGPVGVPTSPAVGTTKLKAV
jgi:hypothetical protein